MKTLIKSKLLLALDYETTGFNTPLEHDGIMQPGVCVHHILEIAYKAILINQYDDGTFDKEILNEFKCFIYHEPEALEVMSEDTKQFHINNGFWERYQAFCKGVERDGLQEAFTYEEVLAEILRELGNLYHLDDDTDNAKPLEAQLPFITLVGKTCQFDREFTNHRLPRLGRLLHHQAIDTSQPKLLGRITGVGPERVIADESTHHAMDDVNVCIKELDVILAHWELTVDDVEYLEDVEVSAIHDLTGQWLESQTPTLGELCQYNISQSQKQN